MSQGKTEHNVLFIENRRERIDCIRSVFEKTGGAGHLAFASTPEEAFALMKRTDVGVVFTNRPENAAGFIRSLPRVAAPVPVIMMLPRIDDDTVLQAVKDGAYDCVSIDATDTYPAVAVRTLLRVHATLDQADQTMAILRSQQEWMSIIDAITDYIFVLDSAHTLVKVNHAFAAAVGKHPRDIIGTRIADVFDLDVPSESTRSVVLEDNLPLIYEKKIDTEIYQVSVFPLQEEDRRLTIHVMKNITEVRRLKDQLYHSDKLASIGLLVSGVAHEINNPLTGTIAYTELLSMKVTDESVKAELKKILDSADRCKKIVDNLLTFSRQRTPSKSLESVNDLIDRAIDLRSYWLKSNSIRIVREYDPATTVLVDGQQIQQVFLNLLLNAEQAIIGSGQANGTITFTTRSDKNNRRVSIQVKDSGPGIPGGVAAKIFDPFFTTKPVGIGTGLGLSIAHGIITEHGGTIQFHNSENGGALFAIELPIGTNGLLRTPDGKESEQVR